MSSDVATPGCGAKSRSWSGAASGTNEVRASAGAAAAATPAPIHSSFKNARRSIETSRDFIRNARYKTQNGYEGSTLTFRLCCCEGGLKFIQAGLAAGGPELLFRFVLPSLPSRPLLARPGPARPHIGIPIIEAMKTKYARREFFSP